MYKPWTVHGSHSLTEVMHAISFRNCEEQAAQKPETSAGARTTDGRLPAQLRQWRTLAMTVVVRVRGKATAARVRADATGSQQWAFAAEAVVLVRGKATMTGVTGREAHSLSETTYFASVDMFLECLDENTRTSPGCLIKHSG